MSAETYLLFVAPLLVLAFGLSVFVFHQFSVRREDDRVRLSRSRDDLKR